MVKSLVMNDRASHERVFGLDLLRAIAILLVFGLHGLYILQPHTAPIHYGHIAAFLGVELFFVLSGFLIGGILIRDIEQAPGTGPLPPAVLKNFWLRRWYRTLPNYYLFLLLEILLIRFWHDIPLHEFRDYFFFLQNFAWAQPNFYEVSWSLAVEEWFYLLMPLGLSAACRLTRSRAQAVLATALVAIVSVSLVRLAFVLAAQPLWDAAVRKVVVFRLDSIMFGVLGAYLAHYHRAQWEKASRPVFFAGAALFLFSIYLWAGKDPDQSVVMRTSWFTFVSLSTLCFFPLFSRWKHAEGPLARAVTYLSKISYSLYLCHFLILSALMRFFRENIEESAFVSFVLYAVFNLASLAVAAAVYEWFEKPMTRLRDKRTRRVEPSLG